jgi:hypothetical protein
MTRRETQLLLLVGETLQLLLLLLKLLLLQLLLLKLLLLLLQQLLLQGVWRQVAVVRAGKGPARHGEGVADRGRGEGERGRSAHQLRGRSVHCSRLNHLQHVRDYNKLCRSPDLLCLRRTHQRCGTGTGIVGTVTF